MELPTNPERIQNLLQRGAELLGKLVTPGAFTEATPSHSTHFKHEADPAQVAFDAYQAAIEAKGPGAN